MNVNMTVINVEEFIGKTVGKRLPPKPNLELQKTANQLFKTFGHGLCPRGVYRFTTHEEANAWMDRMTQPTKVN